MESTLHLGMLLHQVSPLQLTFIPCLVLCLCGGGYPQYILTKAAELNDDNETIESKFYPLYNKILNYWFPAADGYDVSPHWTIPGSRTHDNSTIAFVIEHHQHPFLLVDINPPSDLYLGTGGTMAQFLQHLDWIGPDNQHADQLYAICAIGKRWKACYALKGNGSAGARPVKGVAKVNSLKSCKPDCWNPDITSDASWVALQSIVETIKGYVAQQCKFFYLNLLHVSQEMISRCIRLLSKIYTFVKLCHICTFFYPMHPLSKR